MSNANGTTTPNGTHHSWCDPTEHAAAARDGYDICIGRFIDSGDSYFGTSWSQEDGEPRLTFDGYLPSLEMPIALELSAEQVRALDYAMRKAGPKKVAKVLAAALRHLQNAAQLSGSPLG